MPKSLIQLFIYMNWMHLEGRSYDLHMQHSKPQMKMLIRIGLKCIENVSFPAPSFANSDYFPFAEKPLITVVLSNAHKRRDMHVIQNYYLNANLKI